MGELGVESHHVGPLKLADEGQRVAHGREEDVAPRFVRLWLQSDAQSETAFLDVLAAEVDRLFVPVKGCPYVFGCVGLDAFAAAPKHEDLGSQFGSQLHGLAGLADSEPPHGGIVRRESAFLEYRTPEQVGSRHGDLEARFVEGCAEPLEDGLTLRGRRVVGHKVVVVEADAVRPDLGQPVHRLDRIKIGADNVAERITSRISHRPQSEGELMVGTWRVLIRHVGSSRPAWQRRCPRSAEAATEGLVRVMVALSGRSGLVSFDRDQEGEAHVIRWGVMGPGAIAIGFGDAMSMVEGGEIVAVASRAADRAEAYGDRFGVQRRYSDYAALAEDHDVDAVYVATPQSRHVEDTLMLLEAGKHVLCEKPFAINSRQAREMVEMARNKGLFLMEAIWSRFLPAYRHLVDLVEDGRIGRPIFVEADFGFRRAFDPEDRLFRLDLGGGGLLDLGIYPLQLCTLLLGPVEHVAAEGVLGESGVDEQVAAVLRHANGTLGVIKAALRVGMTCTARISGTGGVIEIPALMHCPNSLKVMTPSGIEEFDGSYEGNGLRFEIEEVHRCLAQGKTESATMSLDETLALAGTLDSIRAQIGLVFPGE